MTKTSPKFPFRVLCSWTHPCEAGDCETCKKKTTTRYAIDNYLQLHMKVGDTAFFTFKNDPWVKAVREQAREQYDLAFTTCVCVECLNSLHITSHGDSADWQAARALLTSHYGKVAYVEFNLLNSYEDEGVLYWSLCDVLPDIIAVADYVASLDLPTHKTQPTTRKDTERMIEFAKHLAKERDIPLRIVRTEESE